MMRFGHDELRILTGISAKIGHSIENILKYRQLENFATTDHLTGLLNTRSLFERLEKDLARCQRDKTSLTVLLCDLDGFKQVNDRFGHASGNKVLQLFAQGLIKGNREYDVVARIGGDEFVLAVAGSGSGRARRENRRHVSGGLGSWKGPCAEKGSCLSASDIPRTRAEPAPGRTPDPNALVAEADQRMYEMKARRKRPAPVSSFPEADVQELVH